jgi:paraquat-inducible protein A
MTERAVRAAASIPRAPRMLACPDCDALLHVPQEVLATFHCPRCRCAVVRRVAGGLDRALAFYLAAGLFFVLANFFPVVRIEAGGTTGEATLGGAAWALGAERMPLIGVVVAATTILIPALELVCTTSMLSLAEWPHASRALRWLFRVSQRLRPWNMVEIFMLGTLVSLAKLEGLARVIPGVGLWSIAAFMLTHAAASHVFDARVFWNEVKAAR